jgi:hypothetical protein
MKEDKINVYLSENKNNQKTIESIKNFKIKDTSSPTETVRSLKINV